MSSSSSAAAVEPALPLLTFLLRQQQQRGAASSSLRILGVTLESLWSNMEHEWRLAIQTFVDDTKAAQLTAETRQSFQTALANLVMLVVVARAALGLRCASWVHAAESRVFADILPSITDAFPSAHDAAWDELYAGILLVLGAVSRTEHQEAQATTVSDERRTTGGSAYDWCRAVLFGGSSTFPHLCQNIALLLAIGMHLDVALAVDNQELLTAVFLQCANMLSDAALTRLLMSAVERGSIRGDRLYATDLGVLLCILRRYAAQQAVHEAAEFESLADGSSSGSPSDAQGGTPAWIHQCEALLLRDVAPPLTASVSDVNAWLLRLNLEGDYQSVVKRQGIDGEVLWSDLTLEDIVEMGIYSKRDAQKILLALSAERGKTQ